LATTRKSTKLKTSAEFKLEIEKTKLKLAELEKLAVAGEIEEIIKNANIVATYGKIKEQLKDTNDVAILSVIADLVGAKRIVITQAPAPQRKPSDPNKPRKPRAKKTF